MTELRCRKCNILLLKEEVREGELEIKCHKCNTYNIVERMTTKVSRPMQYKARGNSMNGSEASVV